jgi:tetratricopeptide (TPR) repeat protein
MDFGIFEKQNNSSSSIPTLNVEDDENPLGELANPISIKSNTSNVEDDENPLGELAKPVSAKRDASPHSERSFSNSPKSRNVLKDHLIAQIVDMGFSADEAEAALAATDNGDDISSAIEILVQQREVMNQTSKKQQNDFGRRRSNTADNIHRDDDDSEHGYSEKGRFSLKNHTLNVPRRNVYGMSVSDGESSDRSSSSVSSNFIQQKEKLISTASEFGMHAFKKASAFYKQSKEVVNKALEDLQQPEFEEDSSRRPKWMQNNDFQSGYDDFPNVKSEERFQDSYDDSSSDDDYHHPVSSRNRFVSVSSKAKDSSEDELPNPGRNKFISVSSKLRDSNNDILSGRNTYNSKLKQSNEDHYRTLNQNESKPPKPIVPSRSTKPDVNSSDSTYVSPARRRPPSQNKSSPTRVTPSKPPRIVVHVSPEQLNKSEIHKTKGNELFKLGQFGEAEKFYSLAIDSLPNKHLLRAILYNNRAAAKLKNGDHRGCVEDCTLILQLIDDYTLPPPPGVTINLKDQYTKALLRRASAYETMEKYDSAKDDYQKLINADPGIGKSVSDGLRRCQKAIKMETDSKSETKDENNSPLISSNQSSNQYDFNEFMFSETSITTQSASQSTFGAPLNAFGFIDPTASMSTSSIYVDPDNPAVVRLRDQARQQEFEDAEKFRLKDHVDQKIMQWKGGKETNLRALISSLDVILWDGIGWKTVGLHELVTTSQVKIRYMKAIAKVHPDKVCILNY